MPTYSQYVQDRAKQLGITPDNYMQIANNLPVDINTSVAGGQGNQAWDTQNNSDAATFDAVSRQLALQQRRQCLIEFMKQRTAPPQVCYYWQNVALLCVMSIRLTSARSNVKLRLTGTVTGGRRAHAHHFATTRLFVARSCMKRPSGSGRK